MQNTRYKIAGILLFFYAIPAFCGYRVNFLSHGPSVPSFGRGETGTAEYEDAASAYFNPSLLSAAEQKDLVLSYHPLVDGSAYSFIGLCVPSPAPGSVTLAFSVTNLQSGDIEIRENISDVPQSVRINQWSYMLSGAANLRHLYDVRIGANIKYILLDLYRSRKGAATFDAGISRSFTGIRVFGKKTSLLLGASALNISEPSIIMDSQQEHWKATYRIGIALKVPTRYRFMSHDSISLYQDLSFVEDVLIPASGIEYNFFDRYLLRTGWRENHVTFGAGIVLEPFHLDYALDLNALDPINRFSCSYLWGNPSSKRGKATGKATGADSLATEASRTYQEALRQRAARATELLPLFKSAVDDYDHLRYIQAADKFRAIMLKNPDDESAATYYDKIETEMAQLSRSPYEADLERLSYARGYVFYRNRSFEEALNEWEKVLQIDSARDELKAYVRDVRQYLLDRERREREKAFETSLSLLYAQAEDDYQNDKWVSCIKKMENIRKLCEEENPPTAIEWNRKTSDYIMKAVKELSSQASPALRTRKANAEKPSELEIDATGADRSYNEGLILYAQGKTSDAVRLWEVAVRLNPHHEKARKALRRVREGTD